MEAAVLLTLGPQQQVGEGAELHRKAIRSQQQALGNRVGGGKKGKELGGIGNLKGSLGGAREAVWEECICAAGLLLDVDSVESQRML